MIKLCKQCCLQELPAHEIFCPFQLLKSFKTQLGRQQLNDIEILQVNISNIIKYFTTWISNNTDNYIKCNFKKQPIGLSEKIHQDDTSTTDRLITLRHMDYPKQNVINLQSPPQYFKKSQILQHDDMVHSICVSKDATLMASGGEDCNIRIWTRLQKQRWIQHQVIKQTYPINTVCFNDNQSQLISCGGHDYQITIWKQIENQKYELLHRIFAHSDIINSLLFYKHNIISCSSDCSVKYWTQSKDTYNLSQVLNEHMKSVTCICLNNEILVSGSYDKYFMIYQYKSNYWDQIEAIQTNHGEIISISLNDKFIVVGSLNNHISIWDLVSLQCLFEYTDDQWISALSFQSKSNAFASAGKDIKIWKYGDNSWQIQETINQSQEPIRSIIFKTKILLAASWDSKILVYKMNQ